MLIEYKKPYWLKYTWNLEFDETVANRNRISKSQDFDKSHVNPFFDKRESKVVNFIYVDYFTANIKFKLNKNNSDKSGILGKGDPNFGLFFDHKINSLVFGYATKNNGLRTLILDKINSEQIFNLTELTIMKKLNKLFFFREKELIYSHTSDDEIVDYYKNQPIYFGCLNPSSSSGNERCYCEMDITHFSVIHGDHTANDMFKLIEIEPYKLCLNQHYKDITCLFDFKDKNYDNLIIDESSNQNFLELVPKNLLR